MANKYSRENGNSQWSQKDNAKRTVNPDDVIRDMQSSIDLAKGARNQGVRASSRAVRRKKK